LGAPGVAAHEVKKWTGFQVHYATIRAGDIPEYLDNAMRTTPAMRKYRLRPGKERRSSPWRSSGR
jgi:acetyl-CoA decarbonylase/synthase complex subunit gamma